MGILRTDRVSGLGGADAIKGSVKFVNGHALEIYPNSADYRLGSNDFTVEFWVYTCLTGNAIMFGLFENITARRSYTFETRANRALRFECWSDGSSALKTLTSNTGVWELSTWHYFTVVRNGTALNIYVDGTSIANTTFDNASDSLYENTVDPLILGASKQSNVYYGNHGSLYISNFRLTNGTALYTGNFTPPNRELTKLSTTNVLCCQSSGNALKEETGKTLVVATNNTNSAPPQASKFTPNSPVGFSTTTDVGTQFGSTFDGVTTFDSQAYIVPPGGNTRERNRGRGLVGGGYSPSVLGQIYSVEIASDGTSADFGDLTLARRGTGAAASHTRGVWAGGYAPGYQDRIDFVTIATTANAIDFGNLDFGRFEASGLGNDTRGVFGPSENPAQSQNVIQFITFATTGNATDFGDSTVQTKKQASMCSNTRGLFAGGQNVPSPSAYYDIIDKITIATTGNAADFGDLTQNVFMCTGVSDSTRGIRGGGAKSPSPANTDTIDFVTIASDGNATDFGNLTTANQRSGGMSNRTRGLFSGGATPNSSTAVNSIDKITIQSTGNAVDFGDYPAYTGSGLSAVTQAAGCSDSHGGLS